MSNKGAWADVNKSSTVFKADKRLKWWKYAVGQRNKVGGMLVWSPLPQAALQWAKYFQDSFGEKDFLVSLPLVSNMTLRKSLNLFSFTSPLFACLLCSDYELLPEGTMSSCGCAVHAMGSRWHRRDVGDSSTGGSFHSASVTAVLCILCTSYTMLLPFFFSSSS